MPAIVWGSLESIFTISVSDSTCRSSRELMTGSFRRCRQISWTDKEFKFDRRAGYNLQIDDPALLSLARTDSDVSSQTTTGFAAADISDRGDRGI